jgi:hypothetical protein
MEHLWNYLRERWVSQTGPLTMESLNKEFFAEKDLLKIDVAFELFRDSESAILHAQNAIEDTEEDPEWRSIKNEQLLMKQRLSSHFLVISIYHLIEKCLKERLAKLDHESWSRNLTFKQIEDELRQHNQGFDIRELAHYPQIRMLQRVANCAKHDLEVDKDLSNVHNSFNFRDELPYLGPFLKETSLVPACWSFVREVYERSSHIES